MTKSLAAKFTPETAHLDGLLERRDRVNDGRVLTSIPFVDDCLGGVFPCDLLLIGAATGVGKTELAFKVAQGGAKAGLKVHLFALEAEVGELAARLYYAELAQLVKNKHLDYGGWWRGEWKHLDEEYGPQIQELLAPQLDNIETLYKKRGDFTPRNLAQQLEAIAGDTDMVVLDHVHVVDADDGGELGAQQKTVRLLRDIALDTGVPVVAVSHVRKKQLSQLGQAIPEVDDLHGASALAKVATQVVMIGRDWNGERPAPHLSPTFMRIPKDRRGRASTYVARVYYDLSQGRYETAYELGRLEWEKRNQIWVPVKDQEVPYWAKHEARNELQF